MNHEQLKKRWRPVFAWVFIIWFGVMGVTIVALLWLERLSFNDASGVIMAMIAAGGGITGTYAYKRTTEKLEGVADFPPPDFPTGD